jgi:hypothetical protein
VTALLGLILVPATVQSEVVTPLARTPVLPISKVVGTFENGMGYRLVVDSGQVFLFLKNTRGLELEGLLEIWGAYYDRQ